MIYSDLLKLSIQNIDLSLSQISRRLESLGVQVTVQYLSRLQNGKTAPAGDKLNDALATLLGIDPIELKAAAYREKIPPEVLARLKTSA